jgi:hypothetical protein
MKDPLVMRAFEKGTLGGGTRETSSARTTSAVKGAFTACPVL